MTLLRAKQIIIGVALVLFTVWPVVHIFLSQKYDISPWKMAGWGMYAAPRLGFSGFDVHLQGWGSSEMRHLRGLPQDLHPEAMRFLERFRWLRRMVAPERLAEAILARYPNAERVRIVVYQPVVDRRTALIRMTEVAYEYPE